MSQAGRPARLRVMDTSTSELFESLRPRLFGVAYRMLGMRADAEDVLQDAWLRWREADHAGLQSGEAWLVTVVTRLAIDRLRAQRLERERYVGDWLPEPIAVDPGDTPEGIVERASQLSLAFMHLLERLGPEERAAFLLRQAFDYDYGEIAPMLGKSEAAVRQMVHRAGERLRSDRPRFEVPGEQHRRLLERFARAASSGERSAIRALFADEVEVVGDGGGKASAFSGLRTGDRITNLFWAHALRFGPRLEYRLATINGEPGLLRYVDGRLETAQTFVVDGDRIVAMYAVRNPDKLARIG
ncbi:MAG: RNA polymerase sigma factor SigJ [Burkholderiaceae bacterium]